MRCETCKHWKIDDYYITRFREENRELVNFGECKKAADDYEPSWDNIHLRKMFAMCYMEGIAGELMTREDFGCVEYEKRI
jgi:hypothetical protein